LDFKNPSSGSGLFFGLEFELMFLVFFVCRKIRATLSAKSSSVGIVELELKHGFEIGTRT
jgi:hypothetical protein